MGRFYSGIDARSDGAPDAHRTGRIDLPSHLGSSYNLARAKTDAVALAGFPRGVVAMKDFRILMGSVFTLAVLAGATEGADKEGERPQAPVAASSPAPTPVADIEPTLTAVIDVKCIMRKVPLSGWRR